MGALGAGGQRGGNCGAAGANADGSGAVSAGRGGVFYGADVEDLADAAEDEKGSLKIQKNNPCKAGTLQGFLYSTLAENQIERIYMKDYIELFLKGVEKMEKLSAWRFIVISFLIGMALVLWRLPEIIALFK